MSGCTSDISSRIGWSSPDRASAAALRRRPGGTRGPGSGGRDDRGARAADLRKISAAGARPGEDDPRAACERAVGIRGVEPPGQGAATCAAAATRTVGACRGRAPRGDELLRLDDVSPGAPEIGHRDAAARAVRPGHYAPLWGDAGGRPA